MVMTEGLLVAFVLLAGFAWARFLESLSWRAAVMFGVFASMAILVKGNGWALALVPPLSILFTRRFGLLKRSAFWLPAAIVIVLCMPWQIMTARLAELGWTDEAGWAYVIYAMSSFARGLWTQLTPALLLIALVGIAACMRHGSGMQARSACMLAIVCSVLIFHSITPTGPELRHVLPAFAALLTFVPEGVRTVADALRRRGLLMLGKPGWIAGGVALFLAAEAPAVPKLRSIGFEQAAGYLTSRPDLKNAVTLTSSENLGEGLMIAETEMREARPGHYMLRATKLLAQVDWSSLHYTALYGSAAQVRRELNALPIKVLILDFTPSRRPLLHHGQLIQMVAARPQEWHLAGSFGPTGGDIRPVRIYVRKGPASGSDYFQSILNHELHLIEKR